MFDNLLEVNQVSLIIQGGKIFYHSRDPGERPVRQESKEGNLSRPREHLEVGILGRVAMSNVDQITRLNSDRKSSRHGHVSRSILC